MSLLRPLYLTTIALAVLITLTGCARVRELLRPSSGRRLAVPTTCEIQFNGNVIASQSYDPQCTAANSPKATRSLIEGVITAVSFVKRLRVSELYHVTLTPIAGVNRPGVSEVAIGMSTSRPQDFLTRFRPGVPLILRAQPVAFLRAISLVGNDEAHPVGPAFTTFHSQFVAAFAPTDPRYDNPNLLARLFLGPDLGTGNYANQSCPKHLRWASGPVQQICRNGYEEFSELIPFCERERCGSAQVVGSPSDLTSGDLVRVTLQYLLSPVTDSSNSPSIAMQVGGGAPNRYEFLVDQEPPSLFNPLFEQDGIGAFIRSL